MKTLVIYDVPNDKCRNMIAEKCKDYGLDRIQYSCFLGDLNNNRRQELVLRLKTIIEDYSGDIQIIPLCDKDIKARKVIYVPPEKDEQNNNQ